MKKKPRPDAPPAKLLTTSDAASMLGMSTRTLLRMGRDGRIAPPIPIGNHAVRWRLSDIEAFIAQEDVPSYSAKVGARR